MLVYRKLGGYKYEVRVEYEYPVSNLRHISFDNSFLSLWDGVLLIKVGYAWDGPSFLALDTLNSMRGSLIHDALYQLMREGVISRTIHRKYADQLLRKICIEDGMCEFRAWYWYRFVRIFAKGTSFPRKNPRGEIVRIN